MVWKLAKLQSAYNELRLDVGTVLTLHKSFVFRLLIFKQINEVCCVGRVEIQIEI